MTLTLGCPECDVEITVTVTPDAVEDVTGTCEHVEELEDDRGFWETCYRAAADESEAQYDQECERRLDAWREGD